MNYLRDLWQALDLASLEDTLLRVASVLLCLVLHEICHGLTAYALGDPTAKKERRLSLNPLHHIDWLGLAAMFFAGVGWAKAVPVDPRYFKRPKQGMALTALAGPVSNFLLALLLLYILRLTPYSGAAAQERLLGFLLDTAVLSIGLGLFNLLPIPPLDGSKILAVLLPDRAYLYLMRYERFGFILLLVLMGYGVFSSFLDRAILWVLKLFFRMVGLY